MSVFETAVDRAVCELVALCGAMHRRAECLAAFVAVAGPAQFARAQAAFEELQAEVTQLEADSYFVSLLDCDGTLSDAEAQNAIVRLVASAVARHHQRDEPPPRL